MRRIFALALLPLLALALTGAVNNPPPLASSTTFGVVKVDGSTITASNGVISSVGGSGTVTTTGAPASGNLTKFSGATSITNGDLSGDCTTAGALAITCTKTNAVAFTSAATTAIGVAGATIPLLNAANTWSAAQSFNSGDVKLNGATSGALTLNCAAVCGSNTLTLPAGTTDLSATGGTSQVLKQITAGAAITVARLACADLSNAAASCSTDATVATNITSGTLPAARLPTPGTGQTNKTSTVTAPNSTAAFTMAGLAGAVTPNRSGIILITVSGYIIDASNVVANVGIIYKIAHGTGTAPTSNAAATGTVDGVPGEWTAPTAPTAAADVHVPFSISAVVTGLSTGTAYWIDLQQEAITTASQYEFGQVSVSVIEL